MFCHCNAYGCRQVVEGTDWRIPQVQRRYAGFWSPVLQRRIDAAGPARREAAEGASAAPADVSLRWRAGPRASRPGCPAP